MARHNTPSPPGSQAFFTGMAGKVVQHDHDARRLGAMHIDQRLHALRPGERLPVIGDLHVAPVLQEGKAQKQIAHAVALIGPLVACQGASGRGEGGDDLAMRLLIRLVKADERPSRVAGARIDLQDIFPLSDKRGIRLGRYFPRPLQPRLQFVFLRVPRTVSRAMASTTFSATSLSASRAKVQRPAPSGGGRQARARSCASWTPSSLRREGPGQTLRYRAAVRPRGA